MLTHYYYVRKDGLIGKFKLRHNPYHDEDGKFKIADGDSDGNSKVGRLSKKEIVWSRE